MGCDFYEDGKCRFSAHLFPYSTVMDYVGTVRLGDYPLFAAL